MRIKNWLELYENAQSRKLKRLSWVPVPNEHDGENYSELMERDDASEIFTAWILMLQIASRSKRRGSLVRDDGTPHTPRSLALKSRGRAEWFEKAIPVLLKMGWIESTSGDSPETLGESPKPSGLKGREVSREMRKKEGLREAQRILISQRGAF